MSEVENARGRLYGSLEGTGYALPAEVVQQFEKAIRTEERATLGLAMQLLDRAIRLLERETGAELPDLHEDIETVRRIVDPDLAALAAGPPVPKVNNNAE